MDVEDNNKEISALISFSYVGKFTTKIKRLHIWKHRKHTTQEVMKFKTYHMEKLYTWKQNVISRTPKIWTIDTDFSRKSIIQNKAMNFFVCIFAILLKRLTWKYENVNAKTITQ